MGVMMVILIPSRIGSKGDLGGYPLLAWSIAAARLLGYPAFVSTDNEDIQAVAKKYGCPAFILTNRGHKDNSTDIDVVADFLTQKKADEIIYLRPTTPFRNPVLLLDALDWWKSGDYDSLCSIQHLDEPASKYLKFSGAFSLVSPLLYSVKLNDIHNPRQNQPNSFRTNGVIDIFKTGKISEGIIWGEKMFGYQTEPTPEIDTEEDLSYCRYLVARNGHPILDYMRAVYG
jgi:CMP-N-acetylneuraminic acid synthetase